MKIRITTLSILVSCMFIFFACNDDFLHKYDDLQNKTYTALKLNYISQENASGTLTLALDTAISSSFKIAVLPQWISFASMTGNFVDGKANLSYTFSENAEQIKQNTAGLVLDIQGVGLVEFPITKVPKGFKTGTPEFITSIEGNLVDAVFCHWYRTLFILTDKSPYLYAIDVYNNTIKADQGYISSPPYQLVASPTQDYIAVMTKQNVVLYKNWNNSFQHYADVASSNDRYTTSICFGDDNWWCKQANSWPSLSLFCQNLTTLATPKEFKISETGLYSRKKISWIGKDNSNYILNFMPFSAGRSAEVYSFLNGDLSYIKTLNDLDLGGNIWISKLRNQYIFSKTNGNIYSFDKLISTNENEPSFPLVSLNPGRTTEWADTDNNFQSIFTLSFPYSGFITERDITLDQYQYSSFQKLNTWYYNIDYSYFVDPTTQKGEFDYNSRLRAKYVFSDNEGNALFIIKQSQSQEKIQVEKLRIKN